MTYNAQTGTVVCKSKMTHRKAKGGRKNFKIFDAGEFIAAITQHIPDKSFQLVRYYGWYSNRARGDQGSHGTLLANKTKSVMRLWLMITYVQIKNGG